MKIKTLCVFGTRPEAIKMAPLALTLRGDTRFDAKVCVTGQHREMLDPKIAFKDLVAEMVSEDLKSAERDELVKKYGYKSFNRHE